MALKNFIRIPITRLRTKTIALAIKDPIFREILSGYSMDKHFMYIPAGRISEHSTIFDSPELNIIKMES